MKRNYPFNSEESGDSNDKQWCPPSTTSGSSDASSTSDPPAHTSARTQPNEPQRSESVTLPTTTATQSFPWLGSSFNRGSELFNADSSQNPYMMPYGRNCAWPDNRMFSISNPNMIQAFLRNEETVNAKNDSEAQGSSQSVAGRSPSPLPSFSQEEVDKVNEMLKEKNTLRQGLKILTGWLKRGDSNKNNNNDFTDMIKFAHNQVWRLMSEKTEIKEAFNAEKRDITKGLNNIASQFEEITKVLETARLQKVWDAFTKAQRKQISVWKEDVKQMKQVLMSKQDDDDEEDIHDDDVHRSPDSSQDLEKDQLKKEYQKLKEQHDTLMNQVQAVENESEVLVREKHEIERVNNTSVAGLQEKCLGFDASIAKLKKYQMDALASKRNEPKNLNPPNLCPMPSSSASANGIEVMNREVFLLTLIATFLYVHPFGASLDYICSYLISFAPYLNTRYLESLLTKFPKVFKEETCGIGASLTRNWYFKGFKGDK